MHFGETCLHVFIMRIEKIYIFVEKKYQSRPTMNSMGYLVRYTRLKFIKFERWAILG